MRGCRCLKGLKVFIILDSLSLQWPGPQFFFISLWFFQFKLSLKNLSQADKGYSKILSQRYIFLSMPLLRTGDPNNADKMQKKLLSWIYTICHIPEWIWFAKHHLLSLNSLDGQFGHFERGAMLNSIICVLLNVDLFSRNSSPWLFL